MKFTDLEFEIDTEMADGFKRMQKECPDLFKSDSFIDFSVVPKRVRVFFDNWYGASVIQSPNSYGGSKGLYELAVIVSTEDEWEITYSTPITENVVGHLTEDEVSKLLEEIEALPVAPPMRFKKNMNALKNCLKVFLENLNEYKAITRKNHYR